jgi:TRAP-type C4-dicarboxylate transport system substrate-binding protein
VTKRYLPKAVWDKLSDQEKQEAEQIKEKASKEGQQHVEWTPAIEKAMAEVEQKSHHEPSKQELYEQAKSLNIKGRSNMTKDELMKAIDETKS